MSKMEPQKILVHCKGGYSLMQFIHNCTSRKIAQYISNEAKG